MAVNLFIIIILLILSYLVGSIPAAYIVGKLKHGVDIRKQGSGNVGGANAIRLFGKKLGLLAGAFDIFKGTLMILLVKYFTNETTVQTGFFSDQNNLLAIAGLLVVTGHCYSIFINFKGGKGGATTAGVVLAIDPLSALILVLFWVLIVGTTRFTSLGNLLGIIIIPILFSLRTESTAYVTMGIFLIILIYFTHRANISRLMSGNERKYGKKEKIVKA